MASLLLSVIFKGVFKGGGGFTGFNPPEIFRFCLKSEGKEVGRKGENK